jgi:putative Holliday junction resolvase
VRILALDIGSRRIGIAISDPTELLARSLPLLRRTNLAADLASLRATVQGEGAERIVVGLPLTLEGEVGPQAEETLYFVGHLRAAVTVPLETWDERYTTVLAAQALRSQGIKARRQRDRIDSAAAAVLLQHYLDTRRSQAATGTAP